MPANQVTYPRLAEDTVIDSSQEYSELRSRYNEMMNTLLIQESISSYDEARELESWLDSIHGDQLETRTALQNYYRHAVPLIHRQLQSKSGAVTSLTYAAQDGVISKQSLEEWMEWLEDRSRSSDEKMSSMAKTLPDYLDRRRALAAKRENLIGDPRFKDLELSTDHEVRENAKALKHLPTFLNTLSIEKREELVIEVTAALPLVDAEQKLFADFEKLLDGAVGKYISKDSRKRWIARFKDPSVDPKEREAFVTKKFPEYVERWKKVHKDRKELMDDPLFAELTKTDLSDIGTFKDKDGFLKLSYPEKLDFVNRVRNAITAKQEGKEQWTKDVTGVLQSAAAAGYVSANRIGELTNNMREAGRSLQEVKNFVKDWAKVRHRYDKVEEAMLQGKVPQGMQRIPLDRFLMMKWEERKSYVDEAERRLHFEKTGLGTGTLPFDLVLRIRHDLDSENWNEARKLLNEAWTLAQTEEDFSLLQSLENNLNNMGSETDEDPDGEKVEQMRKYVGIIEDAKDELPEEALPFYDHALGKNAGCVRCLGVLLYNVQWCLERGYLPRDLTKAQERAQWETEQRLGPAGVQHQDGALEYNYLGEWGNSAIPENRWGPNVMCANKSDAETVVDKADKNKNDFAFWYWGDLVIDGISAGQYERLGHVTRRKLTRAAYALEALGENYETAKHKLSIIDNNPFGKSAKKAPRAKAA